MQSEITLLPSLSHKCYREVQYNSPRPFAEWASVPCACNDAVRYDISIDKIYIDGPCACNDAIRYDISIDKIYIDGPCPRKIQHIYVHRTLNSNI